MIILDAQLDDDAIVDGLSWHEGQVTTVQRLRFRNREDEAIPRQLNEYRGCVFVTINVNDFYGRVEGDPRWCIVCLCLTSDQARTEVPRLLKRVLGHPELCTKNKRAGKVVRVTTQQFSYYERLAGQEVTRAL
jgi:hypothetical protein